MELHADLPTDLWCTVISTSRLSCVFVHGLRTNGKSFPGQKPASEKCDAAEFHSRLDLLEARCG
jgi:hypothetical protein